MGELRRDPIVGRWAIIETENPAMPDSFLKEDQSRRHEATCQFCSGREHLTPPEIDVVRTPGSPPNAPGWSVRVVANKFPALMIEGELDKRGVGLFDMCNGIGAHEVVIETPDHHKDLVDLSLEEICHVIQMYQNRYLGLAKDKRFKYILIFRNFGESAGTSVEHAHSQIIALPMIPKYVLEKIEGAANYSEYRGRCIFCDTIAQEKENKERIVTENEDFIAFCPFVPRYPFETWIFPKEHDLSFRKMTDHQQRNTARILKEMLLKMKAALNNPSYNFFIHLPPVNLGYSQETFHWHIELIPQLTRVAGFEWGTGFYIIPTPPAMAAKFLREAHVG